MRNSTALAVLGRHKAILETPGYDSYYIWQQQALSYIERFLGAESGEYLRMNSFRFPGIGEPKHEEKLLVIRHALLSIIEQAIQTVQNVGIKRVYHNFLCRFSDKEIIGGAIAIVTAVFGAGFALAKFLTVCPNI